MVDRYLHVLNACLFWFRRVYLAESKVPYFALGQRLSEATARRAAREIDGQVRRILRGLRRADLARPLTVPP